MKPGGMTPMILVFSPSIFRTRFRTPRIAREGSLKEVIGKHRHRKSALHVVGFGNDTAQHGRRLPRFQTSFL